MAPPADQAVALVQRAYDKVTAFTTDFDQKFWVKASNVEKTTQGHVEWRSPNNVTWTYGAGSASGQGPQCTGSQCGFALWFLPGFGSIGARFVFDVIDGQRVQFPYGYVLVGTPRTAIAGCASALFYVEASSSQIRAVLLMDEHGNRNRFDFRNTLISVHPSQRP